VKGTGEGGVGVVLGVTEGGVEGIGVEDGVVGNMMGSGKGGE